MKRFITVVMVLLAGLSVGYAERKIQPTTVAGFINKGGKSDDNVNIVLSKSLINMLQMIPGAVITPWTEVEKAAKEDKLWNKKEVDVEATLALGVAFDTRKVITGDYLVKNDKITINLYVYDISTGEMTIKRNWEGKAGMDLFDTIDKVIKTATPIIAGRKSFELGKVKISADADSSKVYKVYVNSAFQKELKKDAPFEGQILAGEPVEVSIRLMEGDDEKEVFRKPVKVAENETAEIQYTPSGTIVVKALGYPGAKVFLNDEQIGQTDENGDFMIYNVSAEKGQSVKVEKDEKVIGVRNATVKEGDSLIMVVGAGARKVFFPLRLMEGGLGGTVGATIYITPEMKFGLHGGAVYILSQSQAIGVADIDFTYNFLTIKDLKFHAGVSGFFYFTSPILISPVAKVEIEWKKIFIDMGVRFSTRPTLNEDGSQNIAKPMIGIGYRF